MTGISHQPHLVQAARELLIHIARSPHRALVAYGDLAAEIDQHPRSIAPILNSVARECANRDEPNLTALVVLRRTGLPGTISLSQADDGRLDLATWLAEVEAVQSFDWDSGQGAEPPWDGPDYWQDFPCPSTNCPIKNTGLRRGGRLPSTEDPPLAYMILGGRLDASVDTKPTWNKFLNLVRKSNRDRGEAYKIIVTDPYLLSEAGQDGRRRPTWDYFLRYLAEVKARDDFQLIMWNREFNKHRVTNRGLAWERHIRRAYPAARLAWVDDSTGPIFHDRLYLVAGRSTANLRGVFGPSLNGLGADSIFLAGELESDALAVLRKLLDRTRLRHFT
ncbi:hypothetical protein ODJ79_39405 [Actinoplanes sp. KI2]|uniref:hypothetical protein n=1 Tax=Actinoplanes sp. KI2 TaxID=2983315 RepID=UPI0021D5E18F|nr:hypothetical protein [Actinoplanes sp. KI2]MCU7729821.1 hypothetical protein [Actinoplanes sp. KI2]